MKSAALECSVHNGFDDVNESQKAGVVHTNGPCLILAGAGTGKTRVLVLRFAYLHFVHKVPAENIALVTFTNKASREMLRRLHEELKFEVKGLWVGTFHSICVRILRSHADRLGYTNHFTIIDSEEQQKVIKQIIQSEFPEEKENTKKIVHAINRLKDQGINSSNVPDTESVVIAKIYQIYQERLKILNSLDFGDLILTCIKLFQQFPDVLKYYQNILRYIMVDEYQDTNIAQYLWLKLLAKEHQNLCCVGDEDQSIYAWRGAEIENILRFDNDFPSVKLIKLEENFRSTHHIIAAASGLIQHNKHRIGKQLWTKAHEGKKVIVQGAWDSDDEARLIYESIAKNRQKGIPYAKMAILVRASFQTREFEERFIKVGVPYHIVGGVKFYERQEIKDVIAYLRVIVQPNDGLAFERILNTPRRGIGLTSIRRMHEIARAENASFSQGADIYSRSAGSQNSKTSLRKFFAQIDKWRELQDEMNCPEFTRMILRESGYLQMWEEDKSSEAANRLDNIRELLNSMAEFENLQSFLDHVSLVMDNHSDNQVDGVQIMTLHAAKGLEFSCVYLPGWEEGLFPHQKALNEPGGKGIEEERRIAYVGITRGEVEVWITHTYQRRVYHSWQTNVQSRFIKELPQENVIHYNPNGAEIHNPPQEDFIIGERVYHEKYGHGDIIDLDDYGLYIKFDYSGIKKISYKFVSKAT